MISTYLKTGRATSHFEIAESPEKQLQILSGTIHENDAINHLVLIKLTIISRAKKVCSLDVRLTDALGSAVGYGSFGTLTSSDSLSLEAGLNVFNFALDTSTLAEGSFALSLDLSHPHVEYYDRAEHCLEFSISHSAIEGRTRSLLQAWGYGSNELKLQRA